jgi:hypothetical protein
MTRAAFAAQRGVDFATRAFGEIEGFVSRGVEAEGRKEGRTGS